MSWPALLAGSLSVPIRLFGCALVLWNNGTVTTELSSQGMADRRKQGAKPGLDPERAENPLSEREMEVAQLLVTGATNVEIARELVISPHTVKVHLRNIYEKLQVSSRTEASMLLLKRGWLTVPGLPSPGEATEAPPPPEPEPLAVRRGPLFPWQRFYLLGALAVILAALLWPSLANPVRTLPNLLSDGKVTALGQPTIQDLPRWESRTPLTRPRSRFALVRSGSQVLAIGGETDQGQLLSDVEAYDLGVNEWQSRAPLPIPLANMAAAVWDGQVYVAGGSTQVEDAAGTSSLSDLLWVYDPALDAWQQKGRLPSPLAGAAMVAVDGSLYLLGGWDGQRMRDEVWRLSLAESGSSVPGWELVSRLAQPRAFLGATAVEDRIYVAGGFDGEEELALARAYQVAEGRWTELPPLSTPRGGLQLIYDGLAVFALGGGWTQAIETHERFDPATGLWSNFPSPLTGEWRNLGAVEENGQLHLMGGWSGGYLGVHLQYQSTFRTFLPLNKKSESTAPAPLTPGPTLESPATSSPVIPSPTVPSPLSTPGP